MSVWVNFTDIYRGCVTEVCEAEWNWHGKSSYLIGQQQTNLSNQTESSGVQILCDIFFSFWALFVLNEVQLDNKMLYFPYRGNKKMCVCVCVCV